MKNLDLNSYGVQEMDANVMEEVNGGWRLFGSERSYERAWSDSQCCGVKYYERKYFLGVCYSAEWVKETAGCLD